MHTDIGVKIGHWYYANILVFQYVDSNKNKTNVLNFYNCIILSTFEKKMLIFF